MRVESAVVEPVAEIVPEAVVAEVIAPHSEPVKAELPAGVESVADQTKMANPVKRTVCRVAHVAPRVTCASAVSVVVAIVTNAIRPSRLCR